MRWDESTDPLRCTAFRHEGLTAESDESKTCAYVKYSFDVDVGRLSNALASLNALRREMDNLIE